MSTNYPTDPSHRRFGHALRDAMRDARFTASALARAIDVTPQSVAKYLAGQTLPGPDNLIRIAEALGKPVGYFSAAIMADPPPSRRPRAAGVFELVTRGGQKVIEAREPGAEYITLPRQGVGRAGRAEETYRLPRSEVARLHEMLTDWAIENAHALRPDAEVAQFPLVRGRLFRYRPDLMIVGDNGPILGVEIKAGRHIGATIPALAGIVHNWQEATGGAPLVVWWIGDDVPNLDAFIESGLLAGVAVSSPGDPAPLRRVIEVLENILTRPA